MAFSCMAFGMTAFADEDECELYGHEWEDESIEKPATFKENGYYRWMCEICGEFGPRTTIYKIASVELAKKSYVYTGSKIKPAVIAKDSKGEEIEPCEYDVEYKNNLNPGTATAKIEFSEYYAGKVTRTFTIVPAKMSAPIVKNASKGFSIYWKKVKGATSYQIFRKKAGSGYVKAATISDPNKRSYWDKSSDANVNGAKYTYKVRAYKGKTKVAYSATKSCYKLAQPKAPSVTNSGAGKITVSWKKNDQATGYKVKYVTGEKVKIKGTAKTKKVLTVTPGKTYKVYVCAYKTVGDWVCYSKYSPAKTITVTK